MADLRQRVRIEATLNDKGASRGLDGIRGKSESAFGDKSGMAFHAGRAKIAVAALGTAVAAAAVGIAKMVTEVARQNDEIAKLSTRLGASTEALSQLRFVAERSGVTFQTLTMGLQRMTRRVAEAAQGTGEAVKALQELGISAQALSRLKPEDQFEAIADAIHGLGNQSDRVRLAMKLFDSEGVALVQTMANGAAGIRDLRHEADALGITLSGDTAKASEAFIDSMTNMEAQIDGVQLAIGERMIPQLNTLADVMAGVTRAVREQESAWDAAWKSAGLLFNQLSGGGVLGLSASQNANIVFGQSGSAGEPFDIDAFGAKPAGGVGISGVDLLAGRNRSTSLAPTASQSKLDPSVEAARRRGKATAHAYLTSYRTTHAKNVEQDINIPMATAGDRAAVAFLDNLKPALTAGFADFILEGDMKGATKLFGATLATGMVIDLSSTLAEGTVKRLKSMAGGLNREDLADAGQSIGRVMSEGLKNVNFASQFGADGDIGKQVATKFGGALSGAVIGANLGELIGGEITSKAAAIGGAIGGAINPVVGGIIGSITGALAGKLPGVDQAISSLFGVDEIDSGTRRAIGDLGTDIQAFGGVSGFFERIGGFKGIRGDRLKAIESDQGGAALERAIRLSAGTTQEQARDVVTALRLAGSTDGNLAFSLSSSSPELKSTLRKLGFTEADIARVTGVAGGGAPGDGQALPADADLSNLPPPAGKPTGTRPGIDGNTLSISGLKAAAEKGLLTLELDKLGSRGRIGSPIGNNIIGLARGNPSARAYLESEGFDIVAASGYHGTVSRPTAILAGEAGPERIDITPGGSDYVGGGRGRGGLSAHFVVNIHALDASAVDQAAERLVDRVRAGLLDMSERGEPVVYNSGVVTPPRV